jgi:hypothetical protein
MRTYFIFLLLLSILLAYCSSTQHLPSGETENPVSAGYYHWTATVQEHAGHHERGTDLRLTLKNWPEDHIPAYVIFRNKKSFPAQAEKQDEQTLMISARIVHESAVLETLSETVSLSDRLVYHKPGGEPGYIEISTCEKLPNRYY